MEKLVAVSRKVSPGINNCELTYVPREPIDYQRASMQHLKYEEALRAQGIQVISLDADPDLPDSVFVEDVALVLDECAIMLNPGAASRRSEVASVEEVLSPYREIFHIHPPDTVDGGDILTVRKTIYVGITRRSTGEAIKQLETILQPYGYQIRVVKVTGCLHLKSAVTLVREDTLLINPEWVVKEDFPGLQFIEVDPSEPYGANAVLVNDEIIYASAFPKTQTKLQAAGIRIVNVDADELAKAEGAVTCCSLIFTA